MERARGLRAIRSLDYTMLLCDDVAVMTAFYRDVLGLTLDREVPGRYAEFRVGANVLALRGRTRSYDGPTRSEPGASVQLAFRLPLADVDAAAAELVAHGVELLEPVHDLGDFGHRVVFVADPERNVIEFFAEL